jgi:hypothetical protein
MASIIIAILTFLNITTVGLGTQVIENESSNPDSASYQVVTPDGQTINVVVKPIAGGGGFEVCEDF